MLSKKFKAKVKKITLNTALAISVIVVLFGMGINLDGFVNIRKKENKVEQGEIAKSDNEVYVINNSDGFYLDITSRNDSGVRKVEIYQGSALIKEVNYGGTNIVEYDNVKLDAIPFGGSEVITVKVNGNTVISENVANTRYISTAQDMCTFRDNVNAGNNYAGKTVEVTADIDLSSVCSNTLGSWTPIGNTTTQFAGTFNGNYHKIKKLYLRNMVSTCSGFFNINSGTVENVIFESIDISISTGTILTQVGTVAGSNRGKIYNVGIKSGSLYVTSSSTSGNGAQQPRVGGITGCNEGNAIVRSCFNNASVTGRHTAGVYCDVGGIVGVTSGNVDYCYNTGAVTGYAVNGARFAGVIGNTYYSGTFTGLYNTGTVSSNVTSGDNYVAGVLGCSLYTVAPTNSYSLDTSTTYSYCFLNARYQNNRVSADALKGYANNLGANYYIKDIYGVNNGFPIFRWQTEAAQLNVKHEYMHVGETKQLVLDTSVLPFSNDILTWHSFDENIASVDNNGILTCVEEGYTTIWAEYSQYHIKVLAIINVIKNGNTAIAQVESGMVDYVRGFTIVLKEDGTVWSTGDNTYGQLGNGTTTSSLEPIQVMLNEKDCLTDIIKIAVGYAHVVALTKNHEIYTWGCNNKGQLGNGTQTYSSRPIKVTNFNNIIDIAAGGDFIAAVDSDGKVYTWGDNCYGQLGLGNKTDYSVPQKTNAKKTVKVACGWADLTMLNQNAYMEVVGINNEGRLGIGSTTHTSTITQVSLNDVVDINRTPGNGMAKVVNGDVYVVGCNATGQLGLGTNTNSSVFTKTNLPSSVNENNKVRYMGGCRNRSNYNISRWYFMDGR